MGQALRGGLNEAFAGLAAGRVADDPFSPEATERLRDFCIAPWRVTG